ncbi:MAG TPA: hypothetical protein VK324_11930, partial [Tepidisphaeraceae bacterium]|nr:hypothetical protein [Tepidisphaeraceae bacterium]
MDTLIVGAGGHGKVVLDILRAAGRYKPLGFIDADPARAGTTVGGLPVFGAANLLPKLRQQHRQLKHAIVAIGDNRARPWCVPRLIEARLTLINAVHPTATVSLSATLGRNVAVAAHAVVCAEA